MPPRPRPRPGPFAPHAPILALLCLFALLLITTTAAADAEQGCSRLQHSSGGNHRYYKVSMEGAPDAQNPCAAQTAAYKIGEGNCATWTADHATNGAPPPGAPSGIHVYIFPDLEDSSHNPGGVGNWGPALRKITFTDAATFDGATFSLCASTDGDTTGATAPGTYRVAIRACSYLNPGADGCSGNKVYDLNSDPGGDDAGTGNTVGSETQGGYVAGLKPSCFRDSTTNNGADESTYIGGDQRWVRLCNVAAIADTGAEDVRLKITSEDALTTLDSAVSTGLRAGNTADATFTTRLTWADNYANDTTPTRRAEITSNSALLGEPWTWFHTPPAGASKITDYQISEPLGLIDKGLRATCPTITNPNTGAGTVTLLMRGETVECAGGIIRNARGDLVNGNVIRTGFRRASEPFGDSTEITQCEGMYGAGSWTCPSTATSAATDTAGAPLDYVLDVQWFSNNAYTTEYGRGTLAHVLDVSSSLTVTCPTLENPTTGTGTVTLLNRGEEARCRAGTATNARGEALPTGAFLRLNFRRGTEAFGATDDAPACDTTTGAGGAWTCDTAVEMLATATTPGTLGYDVDATQYATASRVTAWNTGTDADVFDVSSDLSITCPTLENPLTGIGTATLLNRGEVAKCRGGQLITARGDALSYAAFIRTYWRRDAEAFANTADANSCTSTTTAAGAWLCDTTIKTTATDTTGGALEYALDVRLYTTSGRTTTAGTATLAGVLDVSSAYTFSPPTGDLDCAGLITTTHGVYMRGEAPNPSFRTCNARGESITPSVTLTVETEDTNAAEDGPRSLAPSMGIFTTSYTATATDSATATAQGQPKRLKITHNGNTATEASAFALSRLITADSIHAWKTTCSGDETSTFIIAADIVCATEGPARNARGEIITAPLTFARTYTEPGSGVTITPDQEAGVTSGTSAPHTLSPVTPASADWQFSVTITDDDGNSGTQTRSVTFLSPYSAPFKVAVLGSQVAKGPGKTFNLQAQVLKLRESSAVLEPIEPEDPPYWRVNYTDAAGNWQEAHPTTTATPTGNSAAAYYLNWTVPANWPPGRPAVLLVSANVSGMTIHEAVPLLIEEPAAGGDPITVRAPDIYVGEVANVTVHASWDNATARTGAATNLTVFIHAPDGSWPVLAANPTETWFPGARPWLGFYHLTFTPTTTGPYSVAVYAITDRGEMRTNPPAGFRVLDAPATPADVNNARDTITSTQNQTADSIRENVTRARDTTTARQNQTAQEVRENITSARDTITDHANQTAATIREDVNATAPAVWNQSSRTLTGSIDPTGASIAADVWNHTARALTTNPANSTELTAARDTIIAAAARSVTDHDANLSRVNTRLRGDHDTMQTTMQTTATGADVTTWGLIASTVAAIAAALAYWTHRGPRPNAPARPARTGPSARTRSLAPWLLLAVFIGGAALILFLPTAEAAPMPAGGPQVGGAVAPDKTLFGVWYFDEGGASRFLTDGARLRVDQINVFAYAPNAHTTDGKIEVVLEWEHPETITEERLVNGSIQTREVQTWNQTRRLTYPVDANARGAENTVIDLPTMFDQRLTITYMMQDRNGDRTPVALVEAWHDTSRALAPLPRQNVSERYSDDILLVGLLLAVTIGALILSKKAHRRAGYIPRVEPAAQAMLGLAFLGALYMAFTMNREGVVLQGVLPVALLFGLVVWFLSLQVWRTDSATWAFLRLVPSEESGAVRARLWFRAVPERRSDDDPGELGESPRHHLAVDESWTGFMHRLMGHRTYLELPPEGNQLYEVENSGGVERVGIVTADVPPIQRPRIRWEPLTDRAPGRWIPVPVIDGWTATTIPVAPAPYGQAFTEVVAGLRSQDEIARKYSDLTSDNARLTATMKTRVIEKGRGLVRELLIAKHALRTGQPLADAAGAVDKEDRLTKPPRDPAPAGGPAA